MESVMWQFVIKLNWYYSIISLWGRRIAIGIS